MNDLTTKLQQFSAVILIYALVALAGALKGFSILNNSDERLNQAGFISSQTVANYQLSKGCE